MNNEGFAPMRRSSAPLDLATLLFDFLSRQIELADLKASGSMALAAAVLGLLLTAPEGESRVLWLSYVSRAAMCLSLAAALAVFFPRRERRAQGLLFWEDVLVHASGSDYAARFLSLCEEKSAGELAKQNYILCQLVQRKYFWVRLSLLTLLAGLVPALLFFLTVV